MSTDLPKMPEPFKYPEGDVLADCACGSWPGGKCLRCQPVNFYTADQMREYAQEAARQAMEREAVLREALQTIADWKLPETGKFWDEARTRPVSYAAEFGSNGERGYMRSVALIALDNTSSALLPQSEKRHGR